MVINTKFGIGQEVFWIVCTGLDDFSHEHGVITEINITSDNRVYYHINTEKYGKICENWQHEKVLFPSFESMEKEVLLERKKHLQDLLAKTEKELAENKSKGI